MAIPVFFTQLGVICVGLCDNIMVGFLGKTALASVSLANAVFFIIVIFGLGISTAISSLIASIDAKQEYKKGAIIFYHGLIINFFLSIFMYGLIHIFFYILPYLGQPQEILNETISFLKIIAISFIPWMIFEVFRKFSEGLSLVFPGLVVTWVSAFINIILNYVFLNGICGFPKLGSVGVAYSTLISRMTMLIGILVLLYRYKKVHDYYNHLNIFLKKIFKRILKIGIPSGFHMLFEMSAFAVSSFISGRCGVKVLAAHQIVISLVSSTFLLSTGLSVAATIRIGNQFALKNYSELRKIGKSILLMGVVFMSICSFFFFFFKSYIPSIYIKNDYEVIKIAEKMIVIASFFQLSDGLQGIILGALRGLQDVHIPMWISFFSYWIIALPTAWFLSFQMGGQGIWIGLGIGLTLSAMLLFIRYETITKRLIKKI
ncbi:Multi Antimicrobial Extrusion (MATE) family efflux pump [Blattabacterium sp. (Blattella germanica) str. Bge]|uniref:MATE family efflux transporter n=1 Tax=Blattabacterium sp. (Blattella germanica) TaxID=624186 RepID=UPI0001BB6107|nr:MATE family efflux transporter [Blattabacterium sp. (Blattella germanica)]ACY40209.1 Multi Antimicrobial Extrusion (MATE) family efflux pump [Blattabacterium sp. (Blattella germanica) str. Bge]